MTDAGRTKHKLSVGQIWTPAHATGERYIAQADGNDLLWTEQCIGADIGYDTHADFRAWIERTGATVREEK